MRKLVAFMVVAAVAIVGYIVLAGDDDRYLVKIELENAGGLRNGANVRVNGAPAGRVTNVRVNDQDLAVANLRLEDEVAPVGEGARAVVDTDGFFGERFIAIERGDVSRPMPSGSTIGKEDSGVSVRLDDVVDALDLDVQSALQAFINEQGTAIVGRGGDLAETLAALPGSLESTRRLVEQFAADNQALGRLVETSDRVVGEIAPERRELGRLLAGFGETLQILDTRRDELGETVRRAPATLQAARRALVALDDATVPLIPAAQGLRSTAPALTGTLEELPGFTEQAVPALRTAARIAPDLQRLGDRATPTVRQLRPMARSLSSYTRTALGPFTALLSDVAPDVLGTAEGWARSTQGRDEASHIFRFGATAASDTLAVLLSPPRQREQARKQARRERRAPQRTAAAPVPASTPARPQAGGAKPGVKLPDLPALLPNTLAKVDQLLKQRPQDTVNGLLGRLQAPPRSDQDLLDYLLGP